MRNIINKKLKEDMVTLGSWITIGDPCVAEIMARAGFDWLAVDMEHSAITMHEAQQLIQVIELSGVAPLVRVGENDPYIIKRVMDAGAHGVIVPMVNSRKDAEDAVNSVKYPPRGKRGVGLSRAQGYGLEFEKYKKWQAVNSTTIVQIEHIDAIRNLESILTMPGVDGSIIGPYDLSASMGYPGEFNRKDVRQAIDSYLKTCGKLKKPAGFHVISPDFKIVQEKIKNGFVFIGFSLDTLYLGTKVREQLGSLAFKRGAR